MAILLLSGKLGNIFNIKIRDSEGIGKISLKLKNELEMVKMLLLVTRLVHLHLVSKTISECILF